VGGRGEGARPAYHRTTRTRASVPVRSRYTAPHQCVRTRTLAHTHTHTRLPFRRCVTLVVCSREHDAGGTTGKKQTQARRRRWLETAPTKRKKRSTMQRMPIRALAQTSFYPSQRKRRLRCRARPSPCASFRSAPRGPPYPHTRTYTLTHTRTHVPAHLHALRQHLAADYGLFVWPAALVLADYLWAHPSLVRDRVVVEVKCARGPVGAHVWVGR
jgi:hypothetical protein